MWCILKSMCDVMYTEEYVSTYTIMLNEFIIYNARSPWKQCFRKATQSIICIWIEREKKSGKHIFHYFLIVFSAKIHRPLSPKSRYSAHTLPCPDCEFHTHHTLSQESVCMNLCWWVLQYFTVEIQRMCCKKQKDLVWLRFFSFCTRLGALPNKTPWSSLLLSDLANRTSEVDINIPAAFIKKWNWATK